MSRRQSVYARAALASGLGAPKDTMMTTKNDDGLRARMAALLRTPVPVLRKRYAALGKDPAGLDRDALVKALATAPQPRAPGMPDEPAPGATKPTLTPRTRERRTKARDPRLPRVGATLSRTFKGKPYEVVVEHDGFRYAGKHWKSLTAIAREITGYPAISGPLFWGITKPAGAPEAPKPAAPAPAPTRKPGRPISKKRGS